MKKALYFILMVLMSVNVAYAQLAPKSKAVKGVVYSINNRGDKETVPFATVYWLQSGTYVDCDADGKFTFTLFEKANDATLVATAIGYNKDTLVVNYHTSDIEFLLRGVNELEKAVVQARQEGSYLSKLTPVKTEVITAAGLCKMACCNLAESFENSASVTVGYSDAITGAKQIRLLGLSGIYTAMLDENRPTMRGLAAPFGLSYIPGQWLESIQIAKGPSSVINGLEAITGQINMEHRKPTDEKPLFVNLFVDSHLMNEANISSSLQLNEKWSTVLLGHYSSMPMAHDGNGDGFRDEPTSLKFNFANRWLYYDQSGMQIRFGIRALSDDRVGGQVGYDKSMRGDGYVGIPNNPWGSNINNKGVNGYVKIGVPLNSDNSENIAFVADYTYHQLDSYFGLKNYNGKQNSVFANLIYQNILSDEHRINAGIRNQFDLFDEAYLDYRLINALSPLPFLPNGNRKENSVGVYGEYTYTYGDKFSAVAGLSVDYNNLYGFLVAPRANIKYSFSDHLVFRASGGRGYRSPNVLVDNIGIMSTGRYLYFSQNFDIEDAWTYGGNVTGYFSITGNDNSYLSFDYFRTDFNKQVIVDQELDLSRISIYNLKGRSFTNTYQVDLSLEPIDRFVIVTTFRYTDAKVTLQNQGLVERPLTSRYKGVLNLQYSTRMNIWTFDFTAQLNGPCKLPYFMEGRGATSPAYPILFAQITRKFKGFDIYIGGENLTNYKQPNPIIEYENPFSEGFNASCVWGPISGIKVYAGMRFTLWK